MYIYMAYMPIRDILYIYHGLYRRETSRRWRLAVGDVKIIEYNLSSLHFKSFLHYIRYPEPGNSIGLRFDGV